MTPRLPIEKVKEQAEKRNKMKIFNVIIKNGRIQGWTCSKCKGETGPKIEDMQGHVCGEHRTSPSCGDTCVCKTGAGIIDGPKGELVNGRTG